MLDRISHVGRIGIFIAIQERQCTQRRRVTRRSKLGPRTVTLLFVFQEINPASNRIANFIAESGLSSSCWQRPVDPSVEELCDG